MLAAAADTRWTFEPGAVALVVVLAYAYIRRWRTTRNIGERWRNAPGWRLGLFLTGELILIGALLSPLDRLADQVFAMHMVQHVLLLDIVPICFILSLTKVLLRPATRRLQAVEEAAGPLAHPAF